MLWLAQFLQTDGSWHQDQTVILQHIIRFGTVCASNEEYVSSRGVYWTAESVIGFENMS